MDLDGTPYRQKRAANTISNQDSGSDSEGLEIEPRPRENTLLHQHQAANPHLYGPQPTLTMSFDAQAQASTWPQQPPRA